MLHRLLHELVVALPGPMWSGGLGNAFTGLRLAIELRLAPLLQACLAWVRGRALSPLAAAAALMLPLLGPSNARDAVGSAIGVVADPLGSAFGAASGALAMIGYARTGFGVVDGRAETLDATDQLEAQSLDYYATLRNVSSQRREALVAEGKNPARYATSPARSDAGPPSPAVP